jgi:hypothetical protein
VQAIFNPSFLLKGEELPKLLMRSVETGFKRATAASRPS